MKDIDLIDFHSHILPGADHGSDSVDTSLWQLKSALDAGVSRIIATPHFYPHRHNIESFLNRRDSSYYSLISKIPSGVDIRLGAEVLMCPHFEQIPGLDKLFINGTNTLLVELPSGEIDESYYDSVKAMIKREINVVIAHAERYSPKTVERMIHLGAKLQINASALTKIFVKKAVKSWVENGAVIAIGSDIHQRDKSAYSNFTRAIKRLGNRAGYIKNESDLIWEKSKIYK